MGYSCTSMASLASDAMVKEMQKARGDAGGTSNSWGATTETADFFEHGPEQSDGAVTGSVWKSTSPGFARKAGSARVEPDGTVTRWPGSTKAQRDAARAAALAAYAARYGAPYESPADRRAANRAAFRADLARRN